ncbi:succinyldiaminopimelate aminotransferase domain protein [Mycobacterium kansasii 824]|nr:succinyldiaminopimelate aminotransferase domain protein [Mycobacterium kansasii 824]
MSASLPDFPWDTLADAKARAAAHPDGMVDLSVGTPVDPVAPLIREALAAAGSAPGYPATAGPRGCVRPRFRRWPAATASPAWPSRRSCR